MKKKYLSLKILAVFFALFLVFVGFDLGDLDSPTGEVVGEGFDSFLAALDGCDPMVITYEDTLFSQPITNVYNITGLDSGDCILTVETETYDYNDSYEGEKMTCEISEEEYKSISDSAVDFWAYFRDNVYTSASSDCEGVLKDYFYQGYLEYSEEGVYEIISFSGIYFTTDEAGDVNHSEFFEEFKKDETLWCVGNFSEEGNLTVMFFAPGDAVDAPTYKYEDVNHNLIDLSEDESGGFCVVDSEEFQVPEGEEYCGAIAKVEDVVIGDWGCVMIYESDTKTTHLAAENSVRMISNPPEQIQDIPDFNTTKEGAYSKAENNLEMREYFKDKDNDELMYIFKGANYVYVEIHANGWIDVDNPYGFEGTENVYVEVSDGDSSIDSNNFTIKVGTGSFIPAEQVSNDSVGTACVPTWDCGAWGLCMNGQQTRTCLETIPCDGIIGKPVESQQCTASEGGSDLQPSYSTGTVGRAPVDWWVWTLFAAGLVVILVSLAIYFSRKKGRELLKKGAPRPKDDFLKKNSDAARKAEANLSKEAKQMTESELTSYVKNALAKGSRPADVINELVSKGQSKSKVSNIASFVNAEKVIQSKLKQGFSKEQIVQSFVSKGWKKEHLEKFFK